MTRAKDLELRSIPSTAARAFIRRVHYSGKVVQNSQLHVGVFLDDHLHGVMQLGPPLDKSKLIGLVRDTRWNGFLELNRMAFDDRLPRNSESRALGVLARILRRQRPDIEWIVSFADAAQCGDGAIYRAAGFLLTAVKPTTDLAVTATGETVHSVTLRSQSTKALPWAGGRTVAEITGGSSSFRLLCERTGLTVLGGFQPRYLLPLADGVRERITVPILPYSALDGAGARMYLGKRGGCVVGPGDQPG